MSWENLVSSHECLIPRSMSSPPLVSLWLPISPCKLSLWHTGSSACHCDTTSCEILTWAKLLLKSCLWVSRTKWVSFLSKAPSLRYYIIITENELIEALCDPSTPRSYRFPFRYQEWQASVEFWMISLLNATPAHIAMAAYLENMELVGCQELSVLVIF